MPNPVKQFADLDFQNTNRPTNVPASTASGQPVVHEQLLAAIEGLGFKDNVRVATQSNISLATPGASIDGVTMVSLDRVLVKAQTAQTENGIYIWNGAAAAMTRAIDASTFDELESAVTMVDEGTDSGKAFRQTQVNGVIGTNNVIWASFGTGAAQATETLAGIAEIATQAETDAGTDDLRIVTPLKLKTSPFASRGFSATFGDGSATQYDFTHNLNGEVDVRVREESSGEYVGVKCIRVSANVARVQCSPAPASNSLRVLIAKIGG
jgi:hypothetical protein